MTDENRKEMTEDTKRALEILQPICDLLGISLAADKGLLYMRDQAIGIGCNSTYATVMEAIGYIFQTEYPRFRQGAVTGRDLEEDIKRYWLSRPAMEKLKKAGVI